MDELFQTLKNNTKPFGGSTVIFSEDFRQCLPVILGNPPIYNGIIQKQYFE